MFLDNPWIWLSAVLAGWVFVGLTGGHFKALRRHRGEPAAANSGRRPSRQLTSWPAEPARCAVDIARRQT